MANMGAYKGVEVPVGSSKEQIMEIIRKADAGSSGELITGTRKTPEKTVNPQDATERISKFNAALNVAVDQARQQRKDKTLDFMGGIVPAGALPATSFSQVIKAFNSSSAPLEASLISSASDFAMEQERAKEETKNKIRDLIVTVGKNGGKQETIDAMSVLIETGDIDSALKIGASALQEKDIRTVDGNLVQVNPDGSVTTIWSAPPSGDGAGGGYTDQELRKLRQAGLLNATTQEKDDFLYGKGQSTDEFNFTDTQIAQGAANAGVSIEEFKRVSPAQQNDYIFGSLKDISTDISTIESAIKNDLVSQEEGNADIRAIIMQYGFDPEIYQGGRFKEGSDDQALNSLYDAYKTSQLV
jgi:hypothetical protein